MKKCLLVVLSMFVFIVFLDYKKTHAESSYTSFQQLNLDRGTMLADFTNEDYEDYYEYVNKRKFSGWNIHYVNKDIKAKYVSKTVFSYYNNGTSSIKYSYNLAETSTSKFSVSVTGSISYSGSTNNTKASFKHGLQAALKLDTEYSVSESSTVKENLDIIIDPNSVATLKIMGEGYLTNGVGAKYFFWIRLRRGGFEYFTVSTEYPRLEVLPI